MYITVNIGLDEVLPELETAHLIEELRSRGEEVYGFDSDETKHLVTAIWLKKRVGVDFTKELDELIYRVIGKIV